MLSRKGLLLAEKLAICVHFYILVFLFSEGFTYVLMIILVSVVAQIGPKGSCAVHMNRPQPATSVGYSIYLKKNYGPKVSSRFIVISVTSKVYPRRPQRDTTIVLLLFLLMLPAVAVIGAAGNNL